MSTEMENLVNGNGAEAPANLTFGSIGTRIGLPVLEPGPLEPAPTVPIFPTFGQPLITSIQPPSIPVGFTASLILTGSNLPVNAASYQVINSLGFAAAGVQVLAASGTSTRVNLTVSVAASVPAGAYRVRVQSSGFASEIPLQIVASLGVRITFLSPSRLFAGQTNNVSVGGSGLPVGGGFSVVGGNGFPAAGFQVAYLGGSSTQASLAITIASTVPLGTYRLHADVPGSASEIPFEVASATGITIFSLSPQQVYEKSTSQITLTGVNLPLQATAYTLQGSFGPVFARFALLFASSNGSFVTLQLALGDLPPDFYRLRAQSGSFGAEIPLQVLQA